MAAVTRLLITTILIFNAALAKNILILGGNGFLGSHVIESLEGEPYNITILNRGNTYFNSKKLVEPSVQRLITCDRKTLLTKTCKELLEPTVYEVVIDFSSYRDTQIEQVIDILKNKVKLYIFISTDNVYEIREKKHEGNSREEDTRNKVQNKQDEEKLIQQNQYGANKLACEERLKEQRKRFGFPYVILRLADAIGERDTTMRFWSYQVFMKIHKHLNMSMPLPKPMSDLKFSMVYAKDVARTIAHIVKDPSTFHDHTINLAFQEAVTLKELLHHISVCVNVTDIQYENDQKLAWFRYPSVTKGPLDTTKAELIFDWEPTSFQKAVENTCLFFENIMADETYAKEKELLLGEFVDEILPDDFEDDELFFESLVKAYGPLVFKGIDLGQGVDLDERRLEGKTEL